MASPSPYRILIIGGYGFFGRRLVERLAGQQGLHLIVAGRSAAQGAALVESLRAHSQASFSSAMLDVHGPDFARDLALLAPQVVVHTSGPFQGQQYQVARACIAAGAHYIDLADGREFVAGIGMLDAQAKAAGLAVVSGASSVPALSSAAVDQLSQGLRELQRIDVGISPGNRTERGLSTVQAILSYCGKPLPSASAGPVFGWSGRWQQRYPAPVGLRLLSPCDVPDLALLPARYAGTPEVRFGAGLELRFLHWGMNVMAWLTRRGLVRDWSAHARLLKWAGDLFKRWGSDAGAMHVSVTGFTAQGEQQTRSWQLVALDGDGPYVPTLAAAALIRKLRAGIDTAALLGAKPCVGLVSLADFAREAEGLQIDMSESGMTSGSMYEEAMGRETFARLPASVQRLHRLSGQHILHGWVETEAPTTLLARWLALGLGSPREASAGPLRFELEALPGFETWTRVFPTRTMRSQLRLNADGQLEEKLGAALLTFRLTAAAAGALRMELVRLRFCGLPCPIWLMPTITAEETGSEDRFQFRVAAIVPWIGTVASYRGYLQLKPEAQP